MLDKITHFLNRHPWACGVALTLILLVVGALDDVRAY